MSKLSRFLRAAHELFFPTLCASCSDVSGGETLCEACFEKYSAEKKTSCRRCHLTADSCRCNLPSGLDDVICGTFYTHYDASSPRVTERLMYTLKRESRDDLCEFFAREVASAVMKHILSHGGKVEDYVITYIPRSEAALKHYGFDHARLVAESISRRTGIKLESFFVRNGGAQQKTLTQDERKRNAESSIVALDGAKCRKKVLLFDDIMTSGASVTRGAQLLFSMGAEEVIPTLIARSRQ